ncbi:ComEA family DNA-binding protein [Campylobacter suis]|uniref:Helix-hairpin-helix domain-containing protein n=1 Tax=Campylobacter suis TaxID=2790657 RepID=A0ABN7K1U6_9BACT|nr:helix-hairpin-helix domain-containing protein [Campylobacter suis]CAD7286519.1 hypothetical protein LMG8286_00352 [Campylobacter suis]
MKIFKILALTTFLTAYSLALDLNTASSKELMSLGLNKTEALNIIKYRKVRKFTSTNELFKVRGLSSEKANKIIDKVAVATKKVSKKSPKKDTKSDKKLKPKKYSKKS